MPASFLSRNRYTSHNCNPRRPTALKEDLSGEAQLAAGNYEQLRNNGCSTAERVNVRVKDDFRGRQMRAPARICYHLMFGMLALIAAQVTRLTT